MAPVTDPADLPEVDEWFVRRRVDDGVTLVSEPRVHRLLRCNVWHVEGRDRDLVVDTSMGFRPLRRLVEREVGGAVVAVATHAHSDHVGGLHEFEHRVAHGAEAAVLAGAAEASVVTDDYPPSVLDPYRSAGHDIGDLLVDAAPTGGLPGTVWEIAPAPVTRTVDDGDVIDLGDRVFEALHLPGHSPGSIGLWEADTGVLFSGDAVYDGPLLDGLEGSSVESYVATMRRLRELPVAVVHGGHEASFGRDRLIEICDAYLEQRGG